MDFNHLKKHKKRRKVRLLQLVQLFDNKAVITGTVFTLLGYFLFPYTTEELRTLYKLTQDHKEVLAEIVSTWVEEEEDDDDYAVYGFEYVFSKQEIGEFRGYSFDETYHETGSKLLVNYHPQEPYYNKAAGARLSPSDNSSTFVFVACFVGGLISLIYGLVLTAHRKMYLERGRLAIAERLSKEKIDEDSDDGPTYKVVYQYTDCEGMVQTITNTGKGLGRLEIKTPVVYLPEIQQKVRFIQLWSKSISQIYMSDQLKAE